MTCTQLKTPPVTYQLCIISLILLNLNHDATQVCMCRMCHVQPDIPQEFGRDSCGKTVCRKNLAAILAERPDSTRIWLWFLRKDRLSQEFSCDSCRKTRFHKNLAVVLVERAYSETIWTRFLRKDGLSQEFSCDSCQKTVCRKNLDAILVERRFIARI